MLCFFFSLSPQPFFPVSFCFCFDPLILLIFSSLLILSLLVEMRKQRCINRAVRASDNATPSLSLPTPTLPFAFEKKMCINESQGTLVVYRPTLKINKYLHARKREHAFPLQPGQYQSHQPGRAFWNSHLRTRWADLRPRCSSRAGAAWLASSVLIWARRGTFDQRARSLQASRAGYGDFKRVIKRTIIPVFLFLRLPPGCSYNRPTSHIVLWSPLCAATANPVGACRGPGSGSFAGMWRRACHLMLAGRKLDVKSHPFWGNLYQEDCYLSRSLPQTGSGLKFWSINYNKTPK